VRVMNNTAESCIFIDVSSAIRNIADIIFFASTLLYYQVLIKRKVFHSNLFTILLTSPYSFVVILLPNIVKDVLEWFTELSNKQSSTI
ncbi:hypothetical protein PMAYCL1PPCAC_09800, partial [Pristionchus mayeri]